MGRGTYEANGFINYPRHQEEEHFECGFVTGSFELDAANGDSLDGRIDSDRSVYCQSGMSAPIEVTLYIDVIGGTGRFVDAHGWYFVKSTLTGGNSTFDEAGYILGSIEY